MTWYKKGLRFKCTECGKCCTGSPGFVFLTFSDLERLSDHFAMTPSHFLQKYARYVEGQFALLEKEQEGYDCIFLKNDRCTVYEKRPVQCRTFPWWAHNIETEEAWEETKERCVGIDAEGAPLISFTEIEAQKGTYLDSLLEQHFI